MTARTNNLFRCRRTGFRFLGLLAVSCIILSAFACGYKLHGKASLPFREISIESIENRTDEPKLQDKLYRSLTDEFLSQGIGVQSGAGYRLQGKITLFELRILSEAADVATEYEIIMKADFIITDGPGNVREIRDIGSPFFISFPGSGQLSNILSLRELASERAVRDMARQTVAALICQ